MEEQKTVEQLNGELESLLTPLEKEAAEFVEKKESESVLVKTKAELRATYSHTVPALLREVEAIRKKIGPALSRVGPALDALEREGVLGWHIAPVRVKLGELNGRLQASGLREIPRLVEGLEADYCSVSGQPMGTAEIRQRLKGAGSLVANINKLYQQVVFGLGEAAKGKRQPRASNEVIPVGRPSSSSPGAAMTDFNVFEAHE